MGNSSGTRFASFSASSYSTYTDNAEILSLSTRGEREALADRSADTLL